MPRPRKCRRIMQEFGISYFGPKGVPLRELEVVNITHEEAEALRLADLEGLYHEQAAQAMGVSRATFGRILEDGRRKLVGAFIKGKAIEVNGGSYQVNVQGFGCCHRHGRRSVNT